MGNNHSPVVRYTKAFVNSFMVGLLVNSMGGLNFVVNSSKTDMLNRHKMQTASNYVKKVQIFSSIKESFSIAKRPATTFAIAFTSFSYLTQKFEDWGYSTAQAMLRSVFLLTPLYVFYRYDRPFNNFWYRTASLSCLTCNLFY